MNWLPHDYQKEAIRFIITHSCAGILLDPGLGKTSICYGAYKVLRSRSLVRRVLVVSPLRPATSVWPGEQDKWDDFRGIKVSVLHGPKKELDFGRADIEVINPEGLPWLLHKAALKKEWPWDMLIVDESTRFKHPSTLRFKLLKTVLSRFARRYIMTGSPAPNGLLDLFGQIYILDLGNALGRYITHYRRKYFDQSGFGGYSWSPKEKAASQIEEQIRPLVIRMAGEDYLKLPPLIYNTVKVELPPKAMMTYREMETILMTQVKNEEIIASSSAVATLKCRQIANGGIFNENHEGIDIHTAKSDAVGELVEELAGKPALIAYEFAHDLRRLQAIFPEAPHLGGGVSSRQQRSIEDRWNAGVLPVLLAQPQSVAHGLNLQGVGAAVIWHSLTWNLEDYEQLIRRVWRQGQKDRVVVHHVVAKDTVDEVVLKTVMKKDKTQRDLLGNLKEYLR